MRRKLRRRSLLGIYEGCPAWLENKNPAKDKEARRTANRVIT